MTSTFDIEGMSSGYAEIVQTIYELGDVVAPRGQKTREINDAVIHLMDPFDALPTGTGRKLNLAIGAVEALQLIGGFSRPELNIKASRNFSQFTEPDGSFWGAYGDRIKDQVSHVIRKLGDDPDTRQAIITLWDPHLDNQPGRKDYPCTIMHAFRIRNGTLDLSVVMRSNDVILGLAYDVFQFTQLQIAIAIALGTPVGTYTHHAVSLHLYERDLHLVDGLTTGIPMVVEGLGRGDDFTLTKLRCAIIAAGGTPPDATDGEKWYIDQIARLSAER